jgi:hypothetical protein
VRLHPTLAERLPALRDQWRSGGNLRIEPFLADDEADALLEAWTGQPFELALSTIEMYQYYRCDVVFDATCEHPICRLGRWLHGDGCGFVGELTGIPVGPPDNEPYVTGNLYQKGCYLDDHNDFGKGRAVAYVLGLTRTPWDAALGGHLEFLTGPLGRPILARPPGWNALDLFDVRSDQRWHRVTLLREHVSRVTVSGWFYPRP